MKRFFTLCFCCFSMMGNFYFEKAEVLFVEGEKVTFISKEGNLYSCNGYVEDYSKEYTIILHKKNTKEKQDDFIINFF